MNKNKLFIALVLLAICIGAFDGLAFMINSDLPQLRNHLAAVTAGVGLWLFYIGMCQWDLSEDNQRVQTFQNLALRITNSISMAGLLCGTLVLLCIGTNLASSQIPGVATRVTYSVVGFAASVIVFIITLWKGKARFEVKEETMVLLNGKIFLPGDIYRVISLFSLRPKVIKQAFTFPPFQIKLVCLDGEFYVNVGAAVRILLDDIYRRDLTENEPFDCSTFLREARGWVLGYIRTAAVSRTLGQLSAAHLEPRRFKVRGLPVEWNGLATFVTPATKS